MQDIAEALSQYELERGKPIPSKNHAFAQLRLGSLLLKASEERFTVLSECKSALSGKDYVPDLCIYLKMEIDWLNDEPKLTAPPLTIIEIASPAQGYQAFEEKLKAYFSNGVKSFWLVNPFLQSIALFKPNQPKPEMFSTGNLTDDATGITIKLEDVFA